MALGARRWNVLSIGLASTARTAGIGIVFGIAVSMGFSDAIYRWTESSTRDAATPSLISIVFLFVCPLQPAGCPRVGPQGSIRCKLCEPSDRQTSEVGSFAGLPLNAQVIIDAAMFCGVG
jgi:hypothetical protein